MFYKAGVVVVASMMASSVASAFIVEPSKSSRRITALNHFKVPSNPEEIALKIIEKVNEQEQKTMSERDALKVREVFETLRSAPKENFSGYESDNYMEHMAKQMAISDPQTYCKVNCLQNDHCSIFEEFFEMDKDGVKQYCSECILDSDDQFDECAVPEAVLESPLFKQSLENRHRMEMQMKFDHEDRPEKMRQLSSKITRLTDKIYKFPICTTAELRDAKLDLVGQQRNLKDELEDMRRKHRSYILHHQDALLKDIIESRAKSLKYWTEELPKAKKDWEEQKNRNWWKKLEEGDTPEILAKNQYNVAVREIERLTNLGPPTVEDLLKGWGTKEEIQNEAKVIHSIWDEANQKPRNSMLKDHTKSSHDLEEDKISSIIAENKNKKKNKESSSSTMKP